MKIKLTASQLERLNVMREYLYCNFITGSVFILPNSMKVSEFVEIFPNQKLKGIK